MLFGIIYVTQTSTASLKLLIRFDPFGAADGTDSCTIRQVSCNSEVHKKQTGHAVCTQSENFITPSPYRGAVTAELSRLVENPGIESVRKHLANSITGLHTSRSDI